MINNFHMNSQKVHVSHEIWSITRITKKNLKTKTFLRHPFKIIIYKYATLNRKPILAIRKFNKNPKEEFLSH